MIFSAFEPPPPLAAAVKTIWIAQGTREEFQAPDPIVPDGCVELVFNLADRFVDGSTGEIQPRDLLAGQMKRPVTAMPTGRVDLVGVRLRTSRAGAALRAPMSALRDQLVETSSVLAGANQVVDALQAAPPRRRLEVLTRELSQRFRRIDERRLSSVEQALAIIRGAHGNVSVEAVALRTGVSRRHLERLFQDEVGLGAKDVARIVRLHAALACIEREPSGTGADIAARCGYSDQAHLIRECRAFTGRTPARFLPDRGSLSALIRES